MEEAQKKVKQGEHSILDIKMAMYAATSMLQLGDYKNKTDESEGWDVSKKTWTKCKQAYLATYARGVNRQSMGATDEPFSQVATWLCLWLHMM